jgi:uncharacterized ferritin-like protein (DUF455 family)
MKLNTGESTDVDQAWVVWVRPCENNRKFKNSVSLTANAALSKSLRGCGIIAAEDMFVVRQSISSLKLRHTPRSTRENRRLRSTALNRLLSLCAIPSESTFNKINYCNMHSLRLAALIPLCEPDPIKKAALTQALGIDSPIDAEAILDAPSIIPGRPPLPELVPLIQLKKRPLTTVEGRAAMIHSITHIELNAIDLALDIVWRFPNMPDQFYRDWIAIAKEEALHFTLLRDHLVEIGFDYGSFSAHNALWQMAERTKDDILARVALVPRTLEARGLDASPAVKRRLVDAGDHKVGKIMDVILRDEIGHVAAGNRWYRWLCEQRGLDPISTYPELALKYDAPKLRAPFNIEARRLAGFDDVELARLSD